jgi:hypothetical protein
VCFMLSCVNRGRVKQLVSSSHSRRLASMSLPPDVQEFLDEYPGIDDDVRQMANLQFYRNQRRCRPDNLLVDGIHDRCVRSSCAAT